MVEFLKLLGVTLLVVLLFFVGVFVMMLAAPFSRVARKGLLDLALGRELR